VSGRPFTRINLGGEDEVLGVVNQQRRASLKAGWGSCIGGLPLDGLATKGHDFLICPNTALSINDESIDEVITNSVPVDRTVLGEPGIQSSEVERILVSGGTWIHDGSLRYTKP
jgi:hypothetical protein